MSDRERRRRDELRSTLEGVELATDPRITAPHEVSPRKDLAHRCVAWAVGADEEGDPDAKLVVKQLLRRVVLLAIVIVACVLLHARWVDDPADLLYSTRHGAMAVLAVASAGWVYLLLPTGALAIAWLLVYVHDHPGLPPQHATYNPVPFVRSALTASNRLVMQLCAALTCVFVVVTLSDDFLLCAIVLSTYLIVVPKLLQFVLFLYVREPLARWTRAPIGLGELVYLQHVFFPLVTSIGFIVLCLQSAETLGLRELARCVVVLVAAHSGFAALWLVLSLRRRGKGKMEEDEAQRRAMFRRKVADRSPWEGPAVLVGLAVFAVLPFLSTAQASIVAKRALVDRRGWEDPTLACPKIDDLAKAEVAIFLVSDNQFRALNGHTIAHSPQIAELVSVAVRPVELDLLSVAALDHFGRMYRELLDRKRDDAWDQLDVRWAHLGDFGDLACHSELARLRGRIACFDEHSLAGIVPGNHDAYFTGNFGWHPDWSSEAACPDGGPMSRSAAPTVSNVFADAVAPSSAVLASSRSSAFFASVADLGKVGERPVVGVFFDTSDFAGSSAGAAGVQGEISSEQMDWVMEALAPIAGDPLVVFFLHHPLDDMSTLGRWRIEEVADTIDRRLIAIVSGHTHQSQHRTPMLGERVVDEFIVGSTTDPPQEAAMLALSVESEDLIRMAFQTVPSVARFGEDNGVESAILGAECKQVIEALQDECECRPLFHPKEAPGDCVTTPLVDAGDAADPLERSRIEMGNRARALFDCTERIAGPHGHTTRWTERFVDPPTKDVDPYRAFQDECATDELASEVRHTELVCLSWIASTLQGRDRSEGWTFAEASEVAFERLAANEAWGVKAWVSVPRLTDATGVVHTAGVQ